MAEHKSQERKGSHATAPRALGNGGCPLHLPPRQHPRQPVKSQAWAEDKREDLRHSWKQSRAGAPGPPTATGQQSLSPDGRARRSRLPTIRLAHADRRDEEGAQRQGHSVLLGRGTPSMAHSTQGQMGCLRPTGGGASPGAATCH